MTDKIDAMRERLTRQVPTGQWTIGSGSCGPGGNIATVPSEPIMCPANPDGSAALALIDKLTAERDKALESARHQFNCVRDVLRQRHEALDERDDLQAKVDAMQGAIVESVRREAAGYSAREVATVLKPFLPAPVDPLVERIAHIVSEDGCAEDWEHAVRIGRAIAARGGRVTFGEG